MMIHPHDPGLASAAIASGEAATFEGSYRQLMDRGLSSVEAGNVVAYIAGLHAVERGWTVEEIESLVDIRSLVAGGFIES
jgi:hypothetical protein